MEDLQVNDRVLYSDKGRQRKGVIIETNFDVPMVARGEAYKRVRIKWDDNKPRTWIRVGALVKIV